MLDEQQKDPPADVPTPWKPPPIEKLPPRPAPTEAYSWRDYSPTARLLYIRNHEQANIELSKLQPPDGPLGFDLEWRPNYVKGGGENPVALVQLANHDTILLLQISAMKEFPIKLAEILGNPRIVKCGVGIQGDAKKMYNDCLKPTYNCVDLSLLARTVDNARWRGKYNSSIGLAHLIESYEYKLLTKGNTTRTNWERMLDAVQQEYASNDAYAGYALFRRLEAMIPLMPTLPERGWYTFNYVGGMLDASLRPWDAFNPNYDAGPQPPPVDPEVKERRLREKREKQEKRAQHLAELAASSSIQAQENTGSDSWPHLPPPSFSSPPLRTGNTYWGTSRPFPQQSGAYVARPSRANYRNQGPIRGFSNHAPQPSRNSYTGYEPPHFLASDSIKNGHDNRTGNSANTRFDHGESRRGTYRQGPPNPSRGQGNARAQPYRRGGKPQDTSGGNSERQQQPRSANNTSPTSNSRGKRPSRAPAANSACPRDVTTPASTSTS